MSVLNLAEALQEGINNKCGVRTIGPVVQEKQGGVESAQVGA